jgi:mannonate dehydratase
VSKPITIRDIEVITTQPDGSRLVIVKVLTSEPDLYGVGCATFTQRFHAVVTALEKHLKPFAIGRDVMRSEELFQMAMVSGYWRNGPVLNNAISGIDQALWDIKGKLAGMPVVDLLGGRSRQAAHVYVHADGPTPAAVTENVKAYLSQGYRFVRLQMGGYGGQAEKLPKPEGAPPGAYFDPRAYCRNMLDMIEHVRSEVGPEIEVLHDVHERLQPIDAVQFAKDVEPFKLFFLEDILALIAGKLIDFVRMHVSQMGGLTPARRVADFASLYGVRTAWHGPGDTSPVGHAANLHLDLWAPNFGVQEWCRFPEHVYEMFPGTPEVRGGYMYLNNRPGLGIDIDEKLAARYPCEDFVEAWTQTRLPDGSPARP